MDIHVIFMHVYSLLFPHFSSNDCSINQSSLFSKQDVNKINNAISSNDEADISNLHKKNILAMHYILYIIYNL